MKKYERSWPTWFNKNKSKELYEEVLTDILPEHNKCRCCNGPIYYYDSTFRISKGNLRPEFKFYYSDNNGEKTFKDESLNRNYFIDLYIEGLDIIIEYNGDKFHANPELYNENDKPNYFKKYATAKDIWKYDKERTDFLKSAVKDVIIIWENDLKKKGTDKIVEEIILKINAIT